jgi:hypothetical protein
MVDVGSDVGVPRAPPETPEKTIIKVKTTIKTITITIVHGPIEDADATFEAILLAPLRIFDPIPPGEALGLIGLKFPRVLLIAFIP